MDLLGQTLKTFSGGKILDVATGAGSFVSVLKDDLLSFNSITGVDSAQRAIDRATAAFNDSRISFQLMDAQHLDFPAETFDTVSISNSLHHLPDAAPVLSEMMRVLKPGGIFILFEMFQDCPSPVQQNAVLLHHWWGKIDTAGGIYHAPTYTRRQLLDAVVPLGLTRMAEVEIEDEDENPLDEALITQLDGIIDQYLQKASGLPLEQEYRAEGDVLREKIHRIGFRSATELLYIGQKETHKS